MASWKKSKGYTGGKGWLEPLLNYCIINTVYVGSVKWIYRDKTIWIFEIVKKTIWNIDSHYF